VVARALGELGSPTAAPTLIALLDHDRPPVATNAATALVQLGRAGADALAAAVQGEEPNLYAAAALSRQAIVDGGAP
jgi:HEAT repeat protein